jgi:hypothetical protein
MIKPGNFNNNAVDYAPYAGSMAAEIEAQLNTLLTLDGLPALSLDAGDREVRDRRRLFVAIARGVVKHLVDQAGSINIPHTADATLHPTFQTEGL